NPDEGDTLDYLYGNSWGEVELSAELLEDGTSVKVTWGEAHSSLTFLNAEVSWFANEEEEPAETPAEPEEEEPAETPEETPAEPEPAPAPVAETPAEETPAEPAPAYTPVARVPESTDGFHRIQADNSTREWSGDTHQAPKGEARNFRDHMIADSGGSSLRGKKGRDYLEGSSGNDLLSGGNARDWLVGGRGGDRLQGGAQDDILTGNQGRDTFIFREKHGRDIVTDFSVGKDTLALEGVEFSDLTIKKWAKGTGARVEWDEGTIYLEGVQRDALTEDSFAFV
ncbi:MAG: hypothetical protein GDA53_07550, partial [Rhodobacteraceae bacterium]|nr:hypothetical protein [Paracoccaceae bacterium]MBC6442963.1 hypothetical protein [Paracoccaceae bacterium]